MIILDHYTANSGGRYAIIVPMYNENTKLSFRCKTMLDICTLRMHRGHHEGAKREKRDNPHSGDSPSEKSLE
jgi:hypothetical protein